jgi:hypothetical protein
MCHLFPMAYSQGGARPSWSTPPRKGVRGYLVAFITVRIHSYSNERLGVLLRLAKAESRPFEPECCLRCLGKR